MVEHPNVAAVKRSFDALAAGDVGYVLDQYDPALRWYGGNQFGEPTVFTSRDEFFGMFAESLELNDESTMDLVDAVAVGDSLVMAHVRGHRRARATQDVLDFDFAMVFRFEDGKIVAGVELLDAAAERYFGALRPA